MRYIHRKGSAYGTQRTGSPCGQYGGVEACVQRRLCWTRCLTDAHGLQGSLAVAVLPRWLSFSPSLVFKQKVFKKPHPETAPGAAPGHWDGRQRSGGPRDPRPVLLEELHRGRD